MNRNGGNCAAARFAFGAVKLKLHGAGLFPDMDSGESYGIHCENSLTPRAIRINMVSERKMSEYVMAAAAVTKGGGICP